MLTGTKLKTNTERTETKVFCLSKHISETFNFLLHSLRLLLELVLRVQRTGFRLRSPLPPPLPHEEDVDLFALAGVNLKLV